MDLSKEKPRISVKLERAEALSEAERSKLGASEGLVILQTVSSSPIKKTRRLAKDDSYIVEVKERVNSIDMSNIIKKLGNAISLD